MKKAVLSLFFVGALAIVGSAQSTRKTSKTTTTTTSPATTSNVVTKTSSSSSSAKSNETPMGSTAPGSSMTKRKHKHATTHKMNEKTTK